MSLNQSGTLQTAHTAVRCHHTDVPLQSHWARGQVAEKVRLKSCPSSKLHSNQHEVCSL